MASPLEVLAYIRARAAARAPLDYNIDITPIAIAEFCSWVEGLTKDPLPKKQEKSKWRS